jgi:hypothetical protein
LRLIFILIFFIFYFITLNFRSFILIQCIFCARFDISFKRNGFMIQLPHYHREAVNVHCFSRFQKLFWCLKYFWWRPHRNIPVVVKYICVFLEFSKLNFWNLNFKIVDFVGVFRNVYKYIMAAQMTMASLQKLGWVKRIQYLSDVCKYY